MPVPVLQAGVNSKDSRSPRSTPPLLASSAESDVVGARRATSSKRPFAPQRGSARRAFPVDPAAWRRANPAEDARSSRPLGAGIW